MNYPQNNIIYYNKIENVGGLIICENKTHAHHVGVIFGDSFSRFSINTISQYFSHLFFFQTTGFDTAENFIHSAEEIRFQSYFEALLYKFLISGKDTSLQQKDLLQYALFMPEEQIEILQEIILLFQKPQFTRDHIIAYLCSKHCMNKEKLIKLISHKKIA